MHSSTASYSDRHELIRQRVAPWLILLVASVPACINLGAGFSHDTDSYALVEAAYRSVELGHQRSRTWGFPAYEWIAYPSVRAIGPVWTAAYSLVYHGAAVFLLFSIGLHRGARPSVAVPLACTYAVLPAAISSGNTLLETSQGILLACGAILCMLRQSDGGGARWRVGTVAMLALATATRMDYCILAASLFTALLVTRSESVRSIATQVALYTVLAIAPYLSYGELSFAGSVVLPDPIVRKLLRAMLGFGALLGLPLTMLLAYLSVKHARNIVARRRELVDDPALVLLAVALVLYTIRYVALPDELEYVLVLPVLLVTALARYLANPRLAWMFVGCAALPNVVQLHLFERDERFETRVAIGVSPGAVYQERRLRLRNEYANGPLADVISDFAETQGIAAWVQQASQEDGQIVIIPDAELRFYRSDRLGGAPARAFPTQQVFAYEFDSSYGWRQFLRFKDWQPVTMADFRRVSRTPGGT
jgi:hypothetical protein